MENIFNLSNPYLCVKFFKLKNMEFSETELERIFKKLKKEYYYKGYNLRKAEQLALQDIANSYFILGSSTTIFKTIVILCELGLAVLVLKLFVRLLKRKEIEVEVEIGRPDKKRKSH